jgi:hypothetical protein
MRTYENGRASTSNSSPLTSILAAAVKRDARAAASTATYEEFGDDRSKRRPGKV